MTVFKTALQRFLSWATWIQSTRSYYLIQRTIFLLSTHFRLGLPSGLFLSGSTTKNLHAFFYSPSLLHALPIRFTLSVGYNFRLMETEGSWPSSKKALHRSISWATWIQSIRSYHLIPRAIYFYPSTFVLVFLVVSFFLALPQKTYTHSSTPRHCYTPCPSVLFYLSVIIIIDEEYKLCSSLTLNYGRGSYFHARRGTSYKMW
jgi:hypothetical protein